MKPCKQLLPSGLAEMKGKIGLVFTETSQAEVEIPKEKDAKHSTVSSRDGEICGTQVGVGVGTWCKVGYMARENELGATSLQMKDKHFQTRRIVEKII